MKKAFALMILMLLALIALGWYSIELSFAQGTETPTVTSTDQIQTQADTPTPTFTSTPTPTVTPFWPTDTPTLEPTPTATESCADEYEPNDSFGEEVALLPIGKEVDGLTLFPAGDVDYFRVWGKPGRKFQVETDTSDGVDTVLKVFNPSGGLVAENDDALDISPGSRVSFVPNSEGWWYVSIGSRIPTDWQCGQYSVTMDEAPTPTPAPTNTAGPTATKTPTGTAVPSEKEPDAYEDNYDFDRAADIGVNQDAQANFNPYPAGAEGVDNDFYRFYVKNGDVLEIKTTGLADGLDTNIILYDQNRNVLMGNDDCEPGDRSSCLVWGPVTYTGLAYVLVGPVGTIPEQASTTSRNYTLSIKMIEGTPTPKPGVTTSAVAPSYGLPAGVTPLPGSYANILNGATPTPIFTLTPTLTPTVESGVATSVAIAEDTPVFVPTGVPVVVDVVVYYDENDNRAPDVGEGVRGASVRLTDAATMGVIWSGLTDGTGHVGLSVYSAATDLRLSVPYLDFNQGLRTTEKGGYQKVIIRVAPRRLPSLIP